MDKGEQISLLKECRVCYYKIEQNRGLICQHIFCAECVEQLLLKEEGRGVHCPLCRTFCPKEFIRKSPLVREVIELLENINLNTRESARSSNIAKLDLKDTCAEHMIELECYCVDCKKIICTKCIGQHHRRHDIQTLDKALADINKEADNYLRGLKDKSSILLENRSVTRQKIDQVQQVKDNEIKRIKEQAERKIERIDQDEKSLIAEVEKQTGTVLDALKEEQQYQDSKITSIETLEVWATTVSANITGSNAIKEFHDGLIEQLKIASQSPIPGAKEAPEYNIKFMPNVFNKPENCIGTLTFASEVGYSHRTGIKNL
jgi:hypothetical protein